MSGEGAAKAAEVRHLTAEEVAARLSVPTWCVHNMVRKGEIPSFRVGGRLRFRLADIEGWERDRIEAARAEVEARRVRKAKGGER